MSGAGVSLKVVESTSDRQIFHDWPHVVALGPEVISALRLLDAAAEGLVVGARPGGSELGHRLASILDQLADAMAEMDEAAPRPKRKGRPSSKPLDQMLVYQLSVLARLAGEALARELPSPRHRRCVEELIGRRAEAWEIDLFTENMITALSFELSPSTRLSSALSSSSSEDSKPPKAAAKSRRPSKARSAKG